MVGEHPYLAFGANTDLRAAAGAFIAEGVTLGQQVGYFGWGQPSTLRTQASELPGVEGLIGRGAAYVASLDEHFRRDNAP